MSTDDERPALECHKVRYIRVPVPIVTNVVVLRPESEAMHWSKVTWIYAS